MNAEQLEKWIAKYSVAMTLGRSVDVEHLRALFAGKVLVPVELTGAMRDAFYDSIVRYEEGYGECPDSQWRAMLAASKEQSE